MNILYYSTRCPHCKRLISEFNLINQNGLTMIDLDTHTDALPPYLRVVPTLIIGNTEKYEGKDVFSALRSRFDQAQRTQPQQQQQQQQSIRDPPTVEPYAFSCNNVTNKGFSFINTDHPVYSEQQNYSFFT